MLKNKLVSASLFILVIIYFAGCGSGGGGVSELNTSYVTATSNPSVLDADVINWVDASGTKTTACTGFVSTPGAYSVDVTINSILYPGGGSSKLPIRVESATIKYDPANTSTPALTSEYQILGTTIAAGGSATLPIRVLSQEQMDLIQPALACGGPIYNYYTTISLNLTEIGSGKTSTVSTAMQLRAADYIDK